MNASIIPRLLHTIAVRQSYFSYTSCAHPIIDILDVKKNDWEWNQTNEK